MTECSVRIQTGFKSKEEVGFRSEWNVKEEREFLNAISKNSPVGGEVVLDKEKNNPDVSFMISTLKDTGVSYLNSEHDKDLFRSRQIDTVLDELNTSLIIRVENIENGMEITTLLLIGKIWVIAFLTMRKKMDDMFKIIHLILNLYLHYHGR